MARVLKSMTPGRASPGSVVHRSEKTGTSKDRRTKSNGQGEQTQAGPQPDQDEAERFLQLLDPDAEFFTFQTFDDVIERRKERQRKLTEINQKRVAYCQKPLKLKDPYAFIIHGTLAAKWKRLCQLNADGAGIFITINATDRKGRSSENITRLRARFVDLDDAPIQPLLEYTPPPHVVVESSPGRAQAFWFTTDDLAVDDTKTDEVFKGEQEALAEHFGGDPSVNDLPRVMRLPGFIHRKATPFRSHIIRLNDVPRYKLAELFDAGAVENAGEANDPHNYFYSNVEKSPTQKLNDVALANLSAWVPEIFPTAKPYHGGYRVSSADLNRDNEEDLSLVPDGIKDFGVHDLDDPLEGKRTPVRIVMEHVFDVPIEEIAERSNTTEFEKACAWLRERLGLEEGEKEPDATPLKNKLMQTSAQFVAGFVPPDYLIDGLLQRRYVYSMTAPTGSGKTAVALRIAAHVAMGAPMAGREVEKGRVLFFAGENPDDVRARWIMLCEQLHARIIINGRECREKGVDPDAMDVVFMPYTLTLSEKKIRERIDAEAAEHGPFSLLIVDTSASYYPGDDENDNVQLGKHARMLRTFINLPGGPTVLVTCHPTKTPNMDNLLPRGAGAFLAEIDGNLVVIKDPATMTVEVTTHGKFRGPDFAPFSFSLVAGQSEKLVDTKGRAIWSIFARPITNEEVETLKESGRSDQDAVLRAMLDQPGRSLLELAGHLHWLTQQGEPSKQKVHRVMMKLKQAKLVEQGRDERYVLTKKGNEEAEKTPEDLVQVVEPK
jgi:AAA domain/RepB DNA-primase from phage plasmid